MTKDVGTITGDLEVATRPTDAGTVEVTMRYAGTDEWYVVEGSPIEPGGSGGSSELDEVHERIVVRLTTPGPAVEGNEEPVSLLGFSPMTGDGYSVAPRKNARKGETL